MAIHTHITSWPLLLCLQATCSTTQLSLKKGSSSKLVPTAKQSSYDLVMDSKTKTLRLLAAAWLSPQAIHVVFVPLKEVTLYRVDLKSGQWNASKNVMTAEAKMEKIISGASAVQVTVTPISMQSLFKCKWCMLKHQRYLASGRQQLSWTTTTEKIARKNFERGPLHLHLCFSGIIISTLIIFLLWRRRKGPKQAIFVIGERETTRNITGVLEKYAKLTWVEELSLRDVPSTLKMSNRIFIILTSSMNEPFQKLS
ncbi:uncharacterized protein LOC112571984 [Pomacea canaliculata]|uniref:uncharacterized protein LOC112571984 n=1 Tax=Pomacea canaliculata TaxID=400727 RepID=UPI000D73BC76|nr:uncharacterized protein LOC112571984 [Pomacea canaliculata]